MKFKKSIALIISVVMVFTSLTSIVTAAAVSDIAGHWAQGYIQPLVDKGIISGYPDGTFRPNNPITRAEFCKIITSALIYDGVIADYVTTRGTFTDVPDNIWYSQYVETAYANGFVVGIGEGKFDPGAFITRQGMAKIVSLVYCQKNSANFNTLRDDCNIGDYNLSDLNTADTWAMDSIKVALKMKLMIGKGNGIFAPQGQVTRAETATVIYKILGLPSGIVTVKVLIPEGYTASQIGDRLEANGVCKKAAFLSTINSYNFSYYPLVSKIAPDPNRCYKLEGYLFPDTYEFYINTLPQDVIGKMLRDAEVKIGENYSYSGMTTDEIITLASIIQQEAASLDQMEKVSSVFHNRLKQAIRLQADPTIYYVENYLKPNITGDKDRFSAYYNTYKCNALPSGAICNPGALALQAAVSPAETTYIYFVTDKSGNYYYATTWEQHVQNCITAGVTPSPS